MGETDNKKGGNGENMKKCEYCKRKSIRFFRNKHLCTLHFLLSNPERNANLIDWGKINRLKKFQSGEKELLNKIRQQRKNN